jgi:hypothetical protein
MVDANSRRRAHNTVDVLPAASEATVVPHEPAPTTATRIDLAPVTAMIVYARRKIESDGPNRSSHDLDIARSGRHTST